MDYAKASYLGGRKIREVAEFVLESNIFEKSGYQSDRME